MDTVRNEGADEVWKPITTAPRDGREIFLGSRDKKTSEMRDQAIAHWKDERWMTKQRGWEYKGATHWAEMSDLGMRPVA